MSSKKNRGSTSFPWAAIAAMLIAFRDDVSVGIALSIIILACSMIWSQLRSAMMLRHLEELQYIELKKRNEKVALRTIKRL